MWDFIRLVVMLQRLYPRWRGGAAEIYAVREQRLRALLAHAAKASPYYRRRLAGIDVARCQLSDLPTLTKAEMMENFDDIVTDREVKKASVDRFVAEPANLGKLYLGRYGVSHTSGSQGQPALIVQDRYALMLTFAIQFARGTVLANSYLPHLRRIWQPARMALVTLQPGFYPSSAAFSYLPKAMRPFFKVRRISIFDPMPSNVEKLNAFRPEFITGYASCLEAIGREEEAGRLRLSESGALKQLTNFSEPLPDKTAAWLKDVFGVPIVNEYALGECPALSCGCTHYYGAHLNADFAVLEVVDEKNRPVPDGREGSRVLLTNLYNHVQPFIRYEIDDRVTMSAAPCRCGSPLPHIRSVEGRSGDLLWIEVNGEVRELSYYIFLAALHQVLEIAEHQVLQTGMNEFTLRAAPIRGKTVPRDRLDALVRTSIQTEGLADVIKYRIEIVPEIARGPSGKAARVKNVFGPPSAHRGAESAGTARDYSLGEQK